MPLSGSIVRLHLAVALLGAVSVAQAWAQDSPPAFFAYPQVPREYRLTPIAGQPPYTFLLTYPTPFPSGYPENDLVRAFYFLPARANGAQPMPAAIVLHVWKSRDAGMEKRLCKRLANEGIAALLVVLPYHLERTPAGYKTGRLMVTSDPDQIVRSFRQAAGDVSAALDWLMQRPEIDSQRIALVGLSLGGVVTLLESRLDTRIHDAVSMVGSGDLSHILWRALPTWRVKRQMQKNGIDEAQLASALEVIDPLTYIHLNPSLKLLMVNAEHDIVIPDSSALKTWEASGRPPIVWLDTGHYSTFLHEGLLFGQVVKHLTEEFGLPIPPEQTRWPSGVIRIGLLGDRKDRIQLGVSTDLASLDPGNKWAIDAALTDRGLSAGLALRAGEHFSLRLATPIGEGMPAFRLGWNWYINF